MSKQTFFSKCKESSWHVDLYGIYWVYKGKDQVEYKLLDKYKKLKRDIEKYKEKISSDSKKR